MTALPTQTFAQVPLDHITPSLTNPRKHFAPGPLAELAASIAASGVHQPVLLRPLPGARVPDTEPCVQYELVAGERRYRASTMAGAQTIPAMVRSLTDDQVLEIQIVENLQRADLTELEEAEGFAALMQHNSLSADDVAAKIGKSRSQVYARLKLLDLCPLGQAAMRTGRLDASRALLIARIPDDKLQIKALDYGTKPNGQGDTPSVRDFATWLKANVMLRLEHAPFAITDARLVPAAGNCKDCLKRTGANPDLWADVDGADVCTDPPCYQAKTDAHRAKALAQAEAKGMRLIDGAEAKSIVNKQDGRLVGYSMLSQVREDCATDGDTAPKLRDLLGKEGIDLVLIEHPVTKELIPAVHTGEAEAYLRAKGLVKQATKQTGDVEDLQDDLAHLRRQADKAMDKEKAKAVHLAVFNAIRATSTLAAKALLTADLLRAVLLTAMNNQDAVFYTAKAIGYQFADGVDEDDALMGHIQRMGEADLYRSVALLHLYEDEPNPHYSSTPVPLVRNAFVQVLNIDTKEVERKALAIVKTEYADRIKALKAQIEAQKAPPTTAPLAQPNPARGQGPSQNRPAAQAHGKAKPRAAQPKMGAEEAKSGIAAAMQSMDRAATTPPEGQQGQDAQAAAPVVSVAQATAALLATARGVVTSHKKASVRLLKAELSIGTARAMELMDRLETAGVVSAVGPTGAREVLVDA